MPRKWQGLLAGLTLLTLIGVYLWSKERFTAQATNALPLVLNAHYGPPGPVIVPSGAPMQDFPSIEARPLPMPEPPAEDPTRPITLTSAAEPQPTAEPVPPLPAPTALPAVASEPSPIVCPWNMSLQIVEGRSRLEARTETGVELRISCGKLQLRYPDGDIEAQGHVVFAAGNMEGSCERLTLTWRDSKIVLIGNVRLKGRQDNQEVDLTGDSMTFKLVQTGQPRRPGTIQPVSGSQPAPPRRLPVETPIPEPGGNQPVPDQPNGLTPGEAQTPSPKRTPTMGVSESRGSIQAPLRVGVSEHRTAPGKTVAAR